MKRLIAICLLNLANTMVATDEAWDLAARHQFNEARDAFADLTGNPESDRRNQLGQAAALINIQPHTTENLDQADRILTTLSETADSIGISALYLAGRIDQSHRIPRRLSAAKAHYTQLASLNSQHPLAQAAIVQLALLELHDESQPIKDRFASAKALEPLLRGSFGRSDYHLVLAQSYLFFQMGNEQALTHFLAAIKHGIHINRIRANALVSAGELARELHQTKHARNCYQQFIAENPRDPRKPTVQSRLEALP